MQIKYVFYFLFFFNLIMGLRGGIDYLSKEAAKFNQKDIAWKIALSAVFIIVTISYFYIGIKILSVIRWENIFSELTLW